MKKFLLTKQISPILTTKLFGILFMVLFAFQAFAQTNVDTVNTRPEVVFQDLDGLGEPVYIGEIDAPAVPFSAPSLKMLKSGSVLLKSATTTSSELEWPNPGAVHIAKTAEATGTDGKWKINILVEGKNIQSSTDVVLVIDDSGSMGSGSESKMEEAKNAAKNFVTNLLADENSGIRIAVVTINSGAPTSFNDWSGSGIPETDIQFTDNVADLNSAIDNINAGGGTNIQGGFYVARQNLHNYSTADNKAVVLLSDGVPTYSYESTVTVSSAPPTIANCWYTTGWFGSLQYWATWSPTREEFADNYLTVTNSNYQVIDGTGGDFQLTLYTHEESCNPGNGTRNFRFEAGNHGLPAQYEAGLLINQGVDVYTIGFEVEVGGDAENVLTNSQNKGYYPVESGNLNQVYSEIASNIAYAATNAVFTDPMSTNVILESSANPPTWAVAPSSADVVVSKGSINFENMGEVPGNPGDTQWKIVWNIGTVSESGDKMYYYINLADGTDPTLLYDANEKTYMDYTDVNNNPDAHQETPDDFTIPKVSGGKGSIEIFYYRVNEAGNPINSSGTEVPREMAQKLIPETSMFFEYNGNTALDLDQTYTVIPDDKYISGSETFELNCNFSSENITPTSTEPNKTVWFGYQLSTPPVVTNVEYCVGDEATPLTATLAGGHTSAEYQLYFYTSETGGTPQASITPSTDTEEITSYWVAEGTSSECISPVRSEIQVDVKLCCDLDILVESNSPVCAGSDLFLYERGGEAGIISWTWTGPNGFSSNEQSPVVLAADASQNGFYVVEISDGTCTAKDSIEVIVSSDVITMTDCPTDITECADEIINGVQGKYLDWTIPDFSLNCLGIDSESSSFYMGFGLPEVKWTCWNFNHVQRIGNNEGVVNLWQSTGDGGNPYILSPLVFIDPSVDINMEVYAPAGRDFDWMLYLIDTTGTVTHVGTEHIIGDGLTNEYSINIPGSIPKAPYYLKFEFSGNGNNKCLVDNIYFDGILLDGAGCEGGIEFTVTGPTPGFFPVINDSTITYTATYTPSEGTPATESCSFNVTVEGVEASISNVTNTTCGEDNGSVTVEGESSSANPQFEYSLNGGSWIAFEAGNTSATIDQLAAGNYSINIRDISLEGSCEILTPLSASISAIPGPTVTISDFGPYCKDASAVELDGDPAGGIYSGSGVSAEGLFSPANANPGENFIKYVYTDENGCKDSSVIIITVNPLPNVSIEPVGSYCTTDENQQLTASPAGGTFSGTGVTAEGVFSPSTVGVGSYDVSYTYSNPSTGCTNTTQLTIGVENCCSLESAEANITDAIACNEGTATIEITATGGNLPLTYTLDGNSNTTGTFTGIAAGTYTWSVSESIEGCEPITGNIDVTQPNELVASAEVTAEILCFGETATVTLSAQGGTGAYAYTFNGTTNSTGVFENIAAGTDYAWSVTDENSCEDSGYIDVTQPAALEAEANVTAEIKCFDGTATVTLSATGGTGAYVFTFNETTNSTGVFENIAAGTDYAWSVTDENSCEDSGSIDVTQPSLLEAKAEVTAEIKCFDGTATVTLSATGGTGAYVFTFNETTNSTGVFENIAAGTDYAWSVTDENSCEDSGSIDVTQPTLLEANAEVTAEILCFGETATVTLSATGGTDVYAYTFNGTTNSTGVFENIVAGTDYAWSVTDENSCEDSGSIDVTQPTLLEAEANVTAEIKCFDGTATVTLSAQGGTGAYSYTFNGTTNSTGVFENIAAGTDYAWSVKDANNCEDSGSIDVTQPTLLEAKAEVTAEIKCFDGTATVTLSATGGTGVYAYTFNGTTNSTGVFENIVAGTDYAWSVTDENSCEDSGSIDVTQPEDLLCSTEQDSPVTIFGESDGVATVTVSGGVEPYSYLWDNNETTATASQLNAGTHSVTITDGNGCKTSCEVTITEPGQLSCSVVMDSQVVCFGEANGQATVSVTGGVQPYSYEWDNGENTATATQLNAGTHEVTVTDANGAKTTCNVIITQPEVLEASAEVTAEILCFGETATVTLSAQGGTGAYAYTFNGTTNSTGIFENIAAGTDYAWSVTDENSCEDSGSIDVTQPEDLLCSTEQDSPVTIFGESDGVATVTVSGGVEPYSYLWDNNETTATASQLNAGTHSVTITDGNGCKTSCEVTITEPGQLSCSVVMDSQVVCFGEDNGQATVSVTGGVQPYSYLWDNGETTATASQLNAGTHEVTVTDINGAETTCNVIITQPNELVASAEVTAEILCFDGTATVTLSAQGGTGAYAYTFNGTTNSTGIFENIAAGTNYAWSVTDENSCEDSGSIDVTQPDDLLCSTEQNSPVTIFGASDGVATVTVSGGVEPYSYLWDNNETTATASQLNAGTHSVTITDSNGCKTSCEVTITEPGQLSCSVVMDSQVVCFGEDNGQATVSVTGGVQPYSYLWDNGETTATASQLNAGTHEVTVTDANGAKTTCNVIITQPEVLEASAEVTAEILCFGETATVTLSAQGGTGAYAYTFNGTTNSTGVFENIAAGTDYAWSVTDENSCEDSGSIDVTQPEDLLCSTEQDSPVTIFGESNGVATVTVSGGVEPYSYLWDNNETTATASQLNAGTHSVTITDGNGCETSCEVTITEPGQLSCSVVMDSQVVCFDEANGQATVSVTGGVQPYSYLWDNGETTATATQLNAGTHEVTVTDTNGAETTCNVIITQPEVLEASAEVTAEIKCFDGTATVTLSAQGGTGAYSFTFNGTTNSTGVFENIAAGTDYAWSVKDANSCEDSGSIDVTQPALLEAEANVTAAIKCFDGTATVTLSAQGGTGVYSYTFNETTNSTGVFENIAAGTDYAWSVTDENSCEDSGSIDVTQPTLLEAEANVTAAIKCFDGTATVTLSAQGGTGAYAYTFNGTTNSTGVFENIAAGTDYAWSVTDENSCEDSGSIDVTQPEDLLCSTEQDSPVTIFGASDGVATVTVSGGVEPYSYLWDNNETTATASQLNAGLHSVTVTDNNGCETSCEVTITEPGQLSCSVVMDSQVVCFDESNGQATVSVTGGVQPYSYEWDNGETTATATQLNAGIHEVTVTDNNRAKTTCNVIITQPEVLEASAEVTAEILCFGETATVTLSAQGGTGAYAYTFNGTTNSTGVFENIAAGNGYAWSVTDENSCEDSGSIDVTQPTLLEAEANVTAEIKCFDGTATVTLSAQGGTGAYAYTFNGTTNTTGVFENIAAGTNYAWSVTDKNSCEDSGSIDVTQPEDLLCSTEQDSPVTIFGASDGAATVTVSGGVEPYSYLWDNNETTATASQLNAGTHSVTITDGNGCKTSCEVTITEPGQLSCSVVMDSQVVCFGEDNGQATVSVTGGVQPYSYLWDNGETTATASQLNAGTHEVTVTDANGAKTTCNVIITQPEVLEASAEVTAEILCFGETATVTLSAQGGTGAYSYTFNGTTNSTGVFENIAAGTDYAWSVTDENSCEDSGSIDVTQPTLLEAEANVTAAIKCFDGTATVTLSAQGGTGVYAYTFNGTTNSTGVFENIAAGTDYAWSVTDENSCEDSGSIDVTQPALLSIEITNKTDVICSSDADGAIDITVSGGTLPYSFEWTKDGESYASTEDLTDLSSGVYTVTVTDGNECSSTETVTINVLDTEAPILVGQIPQGETAMNLCFTEIPEGPTEEQIASLFTDNYDGVNVSKTGTPEGENCNWTVTYNYTITDDCGNEAEPVSVTYQGGDTDAPVFTCNSISINIRTNGIYILSNTDISRLTGEVTDNCTSEEDITIDVNPRRFSCEDVGKDVVVTITATDLCGNVSECETTVAVRDNRPPEILCPGDIVVSNDEGSNGAVVNFEATATDNCSATVTYSHQPGSEFPIGTTLVTATATDPSGNTSNCTFNITVTDGESPELICPDDITVSNDEGECGAIVFFEAQASDNTSNVTVTYSHEPGSLFPVGTTTVTITAADDDNNTVTCSFDITVTDDEAPFISCTEDIEVAADAGMCEATVQIPALVEVGDNCNYSYANDFNEGIDASGTYPIGTTVVTWTVTDESGNSATCSMTVTVTDEEDPFISCTEDIEVTAEAGECEADVLVPALAEVGDNCNFTYTNDFNGGTDASGTYPVGTTVVTWTVTDGSGNTATCSVTVTVIAAPVAVDDETSTSYNSPVDIAILENDMDCKNSLDPNSVTVTEDPANGTVTFDSETGMATYTPATGFTGTDTFTYSVCNEDGLCDDAVVTINIGAPGNYPPVAINDINHTFANLQVNGWVMTNDYDPDGDDLTVSTELISNPENGTVELRADGSYTYTPNSGFTGKDSFEYQVCDPDGLCDEAVVTISVIEERAEENRPPVAIEDNYKGMINVPVTGNLLANDYDPDKDNIEITVTPVTSPNSGILEINTDGTFSFYPENDFTGDVTFTYRICDDGTPSLCDEATVTIKIRTDINGIGGENANTTVGVDDAFYVEEGSVFESDVSQNDYDPEGDNQVNFTLLVPPSNGTMALFPNGTFSFEPYSGFTGNDFFIYEVCDDGDPTACDRATAYIIVEEPATDEEEGGGGEQEPECEMFIPEGFSPNNDGINDYFNILCFDDYPNAKLEVYNRWGVLLYEQENYGNSDDWGSVDAWWDGTSNRKWTVGKEKLPMGTYFYILYLNDGSEPITGSVFLNR